MLLVFDTPRAHRHVGQQVGKIAVIVADVIIRLPEFFFARGSFFARRAEQRLHALVKRFISAGVSAVGSKVEIAVGHILQDAAVCRYLVKRAVQLQNARLVRGKCEASVSGMDVNGSLAVVGSRHKFVQRRIAVQVILRATQRLHAGFLDAVSILPIIIKRAAIVYHAGFHRNSFHRNRLLRLHFGLCRLGLCRGRRLLRGRLCAAGAAQNCQQKGCQCQKSRLSHGVSSVRCFPPSGSTDENAAKTAAPSSSSGQMALTHQLFPFAFQSATRALTGASVS